MYDLTAFQRDLLWALAGLDRPSGIDIKDVLLAYYPDEVYHGRVYPNLDKLVSEGYVEKGQKDDRENEYGLTEAGWQALSDRTTWERERIGQNPHVPEEYRERITATIRP